MYKSRSPFTILLIIICNLLFGCTTNNSDQTDAVSAATARKGPPARVLHQQIMPTAAADGIIKIAVLVNSQTADNVRQFIEGSVSEGRSMGFTVDMFISGGDAERCMEIARSIARADYDGLIFAYSDTDLSYDILTPIADSGIQIVTFEAHPYKDGRSVNGLVTAFQGAGDAADTGLAGTVTMRILAAALAGEHLDKTLYFSPWMADLHAAVRKYLRIAPVADTAAADSAAVP